MYRKWPNKARVVDLILGVQRGIDQMSAPRPQRVILGDRTADLAEEYVFPYVQLYTVWYLADFLKANLPKFTVM